MGAGDRNKRGGAAPVPSKVSDKRGDLKKLGGRKGEGKEDGPPARRLYSEEHAGAVDKEMIDMIESK